MDAGTLIGGRFEIESRVGAGGMSAVFRALDRHTGLPVALKMIGALDPGIVARFLRESQVLANLRHPAIVRYVEHGEAPNGGRFLAMEWLDGRDLAARLRDAPLLTTDALKIGRVIADAVGVAHDRGIIHRDIKPSNIFLVDDDVDRVKVLDFGIASSHLAAPLTRTGVALGTPGYMAPEQARGSKDLDARVDVYSIGCVLYQAIAGRAPFASENAMAALVKSVLERTPRLSEVFEDVPSRVDALVYELMSKDPAERPVDGRAARLAIEALGEVRQASAPRPPAQPPTLTTAEQRLLCVVLLSDLDVYHSAKVAGPEDVTRDTVISAEDHARVAARSADAERLVRGYGGRFEQLVGGAILATFEGSTSPTDQVDRAARCALALRARFANAALVLTTGRGASAPGSSVGAVVNRAVDLLEVAERHPDLGPSILIDESSFGLLEGRFEIFCTAPGHVLIGALDALHAERKLLGKKTPCVGRSREVGTLAVMFEECVSEPVARAALLTGPPGVGKSRIRQELIRTLRERGAPFIPWIARGDAMSAGSPFSMVADLVRHVAKIGGGESGDVAREALSRCVDSRVRREERVRVAQFLAEMIGVPFASDVHPQVAAARVDPLVMGDQMRRAFEDLVAAECKNAPLLIVLEDLQWGDRATVQFIDGLLRNLVEAPLMVVATARPEIEDNFGKVWFERGAQEIRVGPLTAKASRRLVEAVTSEELPADRVEKIVHRAAGHPLMLEELLRAMHDQRAGGLPDTALAMVEVRLMALDHEARRVLRAASVFGRSFWAQGVGTLIVGHGSDAILEEWLRFLADEEWIVRRETSRFPEEVEYGFTQDVVREAVYAMLTDEDRRLGHALAGDWLNAVRERDDVVVARHFELGGVQERAVERYERAANQALDGNDFAAAIELGRRIVSLDADAAVIGRVQTICGEAHTHLGSFEDALEASGTARAVTQVGSADWIRATGVHAQAAGKLGRIEVVQTDGHELLENDASRSNCVAYASAGAALTVQLMIGGDMPLAILVADRLEELERRFETPEPSMVGWVSKAVSARWAFVGDHGRTLALLRRAVDAFEQAGDIRSVCSLRKTQGWYASECGALEEGERALLDSIAAAERLGLPNLVAHAQMDAGSPLIRLGKLTEARRLLRASLAVFEAQHDHRLASGALGGLAWIDGLQGDHVSSLTHATRAVEVAPSPTIKIGAMSFLAQAQFFAGDAAGALATADVALKILEDVGVAEEGVSLLCLIRAEALEAAGRHGEAVEAITDACRRLRQRAEKISNSDLRTSFLGRIVQHRRTLELAEAWAT